MPAKKKTKKRRRKIRARVIVLLFLVIAAVAVTFATPTFNIKEVAVAGNEKIKTESIKIASGIAENYNIFRISTRRAEKNIEKMPYVHNATIKRKLPDKVVIQIEESKICGYIQNSKALIGIDKYGKVVETLPLKTETDKYKITGIKVKSFELGEKITIDDEQIADIILLYMDSFEKSGISDNLAQVFVNSPADTGFVTKNGLTVKLGSTDELDYKIKYFKRILEEIGEEGGELDLTGSDKALFHAN